MEEKKIQGEENKEGAKPQTVDDPFEQLRELTKGTLKLMKPIRARSQDVTELHYDFCGLTGEEMMDVLDSDSVGNMFAISNKQALALFAETAGNCTELVDNKDILKRISGPDSVKAMQLAKLFYSASSQAGNKNISKG